MARGAPRDYHFQVPNQVLAGQALVRESAEVGGAAQQLRFSYRVGDTELLEHVERSCAFAHRFDGIDAAGAEQESGLEGVFAEGPHVAGLRAEAAASAALVVRGAGDIVEFTAGAVFTFTDHFRGNGPYLLCAVEPTVTQDYLGVSAESVPAPVYENRFECRPADVPFRPQRTTPRPRIEGPQTATVTAPKDEPAFLDKFGRIKVKFHWDRSHTKGADTSCWLRVGQVWAGKRWGAFFWPRPGHEVIVAFEDGDPDRPLVVGNVYNADNLPALSPKEHPAANGIKSCSLGRDPLKHFNSLVFYDDPGDEHIHVHSETHELFSSKQTKYANNLGPAIQFSGVLPMPPGSGGGGGWLDYSTLVNVGQGKPNPITLALPGAASYAYGEHFEATVGGGRNTHILGGGDVKVIFDLESLLGSIGGEKIPAVGSLLETLASVGLLGVGGDANLVLGSKSQSTFGTTLDFRAWRSFQYTFEPDEKPTLMEAASVSAIWVLAALVVVTASAGDILGRVFATIQEPKEEGKPAADEKASTPEETQRRRPPQRMAARRRRVPRRKCRNGRRSSASLCPIACTPCSSPWKAPSPTCNAWRSNRATAAT